MPFETTLRDIAADAAAIRLLIADAIDDADAAVITPAAAAAATLLPFA